MLTKRTQMQNAFALTVATGLLTVLPYTASANSVATNQVSKITTEHADTGSVVEIVTSQTPNFSVFRLADPFRILIDINDASLTSAFAAPAAMAHPALTSVKANAITDENSSIVRIEIALDARYKYDVKAKGKRIVARIATPQLSKSTSFGKLIKKVSKDSVEIRSKISGATPQASDVSIMELENPRRVVIDIKGAKVAPKYQKINIQKQAVRRARIGARKDGVRLVVDLKNTKARPEVNVDAIEGHLVVAVLPAPKAKPVPVTKPEPIKEQEIKTAAAPEPSIDENVLDAPVQAISIPAPVTKVAKKAAKDKYQPALIEDVRFEPKKGFVRLTIDLSKDAAVIKDSSSQRSQPILRLQNAKLPEALVRKLDTSEVAAEVVNAISTFNDGQDILIAAEIDESTEHRHWRKGNRLFWDFRSSVAKKAQAVQAKVTAPVAAPTARVIPYAEQVTSSFSSDAASTAGKIFSARKRYRGRRISLDLKDAEIHNVLRLLADVAKLNIVASDDVKGTVTLKLRNVPWDQALDIILQSKKLDKTRNGNIIRVAPLATLVAEEKERLSRKEAKVLLDPLSIRLIPVNYASADGLAGQIEPLLTEQRGSVKVDERTNVLVVEDIAEVLLKVERLVRTLDTQTPQILIEARIVEAATSFVRDLGIQWGGASALATQYGTQTGLQFPNRVTIRGAAEDEQAPTTGVLEQGNNFAINLPAPIGTGKGGGVGFVFGSAGGSQLLSLRLSAAEQQGKTKIISAPRIVTLNATEAKITSGEKVPITVVTANGPTTRFIDANLELSTVPLVTADGNIMLQIKAKKNELSNRRDDIGTPGIITREAQTQMLVRDGDTAVMGGIYRRTAAKSEDYVPLLGRIPVLGWLFKKQARTDSREELLIFVSPRIINRDSSTVTGG